MLFRQLRGRLEAEATEAVLLPLLYQLYEVLLKQHKELMGYFEE